MLKKLQEKRRALLTRSDELTEIFMEGVTEERDAAAIAELRAEYNGIKDEVRNLNELIEDAQERAGIKDEKLKDEARNDAETPEARGNADDGTDKRHAVQRSVEDKSNEKIVITRHLGKTAEQRANIVQVAAPYGDIEAPLRGVYDVVPDALTSKLSFYPAPDQPQTLRVPYLGKAGAFSPIAELAAATDAGITQSMFELTTVLEGEDATFSREMVAQNPGTAAIVASTLLNGLARHWRAKGLAAMNAVSALNAPINGAVAFDNLDDVEDLIALIDDDDEEGSEFFLSRTHIATLRGVVDAGGHHVWVPLRDGSTELRGFDVTKCGVAKPTFGHASAITLLSGNAEIESWEEKNERGTKSRVVVACAAGLNNAALLANLG